MPTIRSAPIARPSRFRRLLERGIDGLRIAVAGGYFKRRSAEALAALDRVAAALASTATSRFPRPSAPAAAAYHHHRDRRRERCIWTAAHAAG